MTGSAEPIAEMMRRFAESAVEVVDEAGGELLGYSVESMPAERRRGARDDHRRHALPLPRLKVARRAD